MENCDRYRQPDGMDEGVSQKSVLEYIGKPYRWWLALMKSETILFVIGLIIAAVSIATIPYASKAFGSVIDVVYRQGDKSQLAYYLTIGFSIPMIRGLSVVLSRYLFERTSQNVLMKVREGLFGRLEELDITFFEKTSSGEIMARMTGDFDMLRHFSAFVVMALIEQIILFVSGIYVMVKINWILALASLVIALPILYISDKFRKESGEAWKAVRGQFSRMNAVVQQNIEGNRVVRAFFRRDYEVEKFEEENLKYRELNFDATKIWLKYVPLIEIFAGLVAIPVIAVGGIMVINETITLGEFSAFSGILYVISNPLRSLSSLVSDFQRFGISAEKIMDMLSENSRLKTQESEVIKLDEADNCFVEFKNVSFRYPLSKDSKGVEGNWSSVDEYKVKLKDKNVLKNINLKVRKGEKIGIVGATGSGKTTLVNLLIRLYDVSEGELLINGKNVRDISLNELRHIVGMVMQDVFLFSDTVDGNIAYGDPEIDSQTVHESAKLACADDFVIKMPEGYNTIVGERGMGLSGGQKQRLSLARALCYKPDILILDDTTSALDVETESEIWENLEEFFGSRTVFIVAHRISSVRKCDQIIVLDQGSIVESGTHESLKNSGGVYSEIYKIQSGLETDLWLCEV